MNTVKIIKKTTGSLWNYYRAEPNSTIGDNNITHSILNSESFEYKANFMKNGVRHDNLILTWFKNCVLIDKST